MLLACWMRECRYSFGNAGERQLLRESRVEESWKKKLPELH